MINETACGDGLLLPLVAIRWQVSGSAFSMKSTDEAKSYKNFNAAGI